MKVVIDTNVLVATLKSEERAAFAMLEALLTECFEFALSVPLFWNMEMS
jgi:predicted nucleic acid-binding protein